MPGEGGRGVSAPGEGGVCSGGCLFLGGWSAPGGCLIPGGSAPGGCLLPGGLLPWVGGGGGYLPRYSPPVNRILDTRL